MLANRRQFIGQVAALAPLLTLARAQGFAADAPSIDEALAKSAAAHQRLMAVPDLHMHGAETIAMLVYPGFTALDLVGPHYFLAGMMGAKVHLVTNQSDLSPVPSDLGLAIAPTCTFTDCPADLTVLFTPGGTDGTLRAMEDRATRTFLAARGAHARYVTSVCTGSLLLGAAGLLRGRRATSHWVTRDALAAFGATPVDARVVTDGNVITGAGVSAGLDFGVALVAALRGRPYAEALMLQAEYAPAPPFQGGTIATTPPAIAGPLQDMFAPLVARTRALAAKLGPEL
jgi:putative intracellular protease/amidase